MKIILVGSHSTGKTTLLNLLKELPQFKDYKIVTEVLRNLNKEGLPINKESNNETQLLAFNEYLKQFLLNDNLVSDRGFYDVYAYTWGAAKRDKVDSYILNYQNWVMNRYKGIFDKIFYIPIEFPMEKDGIRDEDIEYQKEIDKNILYCLKMINTNYITITGTVEQRMEQILKNI